MNSDIVVVFGQGGQGSQGRCLNFDIAAAQQCCEMTCDPPTATGVRGRYSLRTFPTAPPARSTSAALGRRYPLCNSSTMARCAKRRTEELRNGCAGLRRRIREEGEVNIENLKLRGC